VWRRFTSVGRSGERWWAVKVEAVGSEAKKRGKEDTKSTGVQERRTRPRGVQPHPYPSRITYHVLRFTPYRNDFRSSGSRVVRMTSPHRRQRQVIRLGVPEMPRMRAIQAQKPYEASELTMWCDSSWPQEQVGMDGEDMRASIHGRCDVPCSHL